jgi:5'-phosphate synthase pdxT subunit
MAKPVGLLTLQGDYDKHRQAFGALGAETFDVRRPWELGRVSCLVIPGGESTTLTRLVDRVGLREPIIDFASGHPVMGTCAGLIMLASRLTGEKRSDYGVEPLGLMDCTVIRNGYGRQIDSFTADVDLSGLDEPGDPFPAVFIRAPRITAVGPDVEVLARHGQEPVIIRQGQLLGMAFHPELTEDLRVHRSFLHLLGG